MTGAGGRSPMTAPDLLLDGLAGAALTVALAHGAGAPMDSEFMAAPSNSGKGAVHAG